MRQLRTPLKLLIVTLIVGGVGAALIMGSERGYFSKAVQQESSVPPKVDIGAAPAQNMPVATVQPSAPTEIKTAAVNTTGTVKLLTIPWNATMSLHAANGGPSTAAGSIMAKHGIKLNVERQDDYSQMQAEQLAFAQEVAKGVAMPTQGAAFAVIMGDGYAPYAAGLKENMDKIGQKFEVIGALGYSRGEDKCMMTPDVKINPQKARGALVGAVLRDGDWNICVKWAGDNGIPINPDEKTYDPDAMNFIAVSAFTEADEKYITGYCEDRPVVKNGKTTGQKARVCANGTATWTPGDVKVAKDKGGLVAVASTKEYMWQMPSIVIGNKQWMSQNRAWVENFLAAAFEGAELIKPDGVNINESALLKAAAAAAQVYKEGDANYWATYYKGVVENDKTGMPVSLGGSTSNNLADNLHLFGVGKNTDNIYKRVYTVFGDIAKRYYPNLVPSYPKYDTVVNTTYLESLAAKSTAMRQADTPVYNAGTVSVTNVVSKKGYNIEFETGKATFTPAAMTVLDDLLNQISVSGLNVQINGHTDNVGSPELNMTLSKRRADAVKAWLEANAPATMTSGRIKTRAYGDTLPVADNKGADGRAKNRRVEIVLGN